MNSNFNQLSRRMNDLYRARHMKRLWNFIRSTKRDTSVHDDIGVSDLHKYFSAKLCDSEYTSAVILEAEICVREKYDDLLNGELNSKVMSEAMVKRYIKKLHLGSSPSIDGIVSEHLKYAINSGIVRHLSVMRSLCLRYGIVPISFTKGVLVPLLKKPTMDPSVPNNYRPVTISSTLSKLLEVYILEVCGHHDFSDLQFGFITGRRTNMAVSLSMMLYLTVQSVGLPFIHVHAC